MRKSTTWAVAAWVLAAGAGDALAGGSPENILLIINPASAESMYVGNYYKNARNIPDQNVLYITPSANHMDPAQPGDPPLIPYTVAAGPNADLDAVAGQLAQAAIGNHIDYIVVANTGEFFNSIPGRINDGCWPVSRLSQSSLFTTAFLRSTLLAGGVPVTTQNQYYSPDPNAPRAYNAQVLWLAGSPSTSPSGRRYYIGAQLGYTGAFGNSLAEVLAMIDRAVGADGTHPPGTFYFMNTSDSIRNVRAPTFANPANYNNMAAFINARGGSAMVINDVLPQNHLDNLGIMTGWPNPVVDLDPIAPQPGSFCDHLTSWAATFDSNQQTKISSWIRRGCAGSAGTVEEPCNYTGKFPHASFHANYFQGLSLGEAFLRSCAYVPFQNLLYGDPMTRPWGTFPSVTGNVPGGTLSGIVTFTPAVSTSLPGAAVAGVSLYIDGVLHSTRSAGEAFTVNSVALADGWHDARVLAWDNTLVKNTGRWVGSLTTANAGRSATIGMNTTTGEMTTLFTATAGAGGGSVQQVRLLQNGRVVAAGPGPGALSVYGRNLGSGRSRVQVEALFTDGKVARSAPATLDIAYTVGPFSGLAPVAYSYTKRVARGGPFVVELPARFDDGLSGAVYTIVSPPSQGTTVGAGDKSYRVMTATGAACGQDQFTFRVDTPSGQSNTATVTLIYGSAGCPADAQPDGQLNVLDFSAFLNIFAANDLRADINGDCALNVLDFGGFLNAFAAGCP